MLLSAPRLTTTCRGEFGGPPKTGDEVACCDYLQNILAHGHSSAYFNPDTLSSVVVTYTWPLYQGTSAEEFMLGKDRVI